MWLVRCDFISQPALFVAPIFKEHSTLHTFDGIEVVIDWSVLEPLLLQGKGCTG